MAGHHAAGDAVHRDQLEHITAAEQSHPPQLHLAHQGLIGAVQQLLSRLTASVKGAADQGAPKAARGQAATVFTGERHPLGDALVDDAATDLRQSLTAGFSGAEVTTLECVGEQAANAVAIHGDRSGGIDSALGCHRVGPPRAVMKAEHCHAIPLLRQSCGR